MFDEERQLLAQQRMYHSGSIGGIEERRGRREQLKAAALESLSAYKNTVSDGTLMALSHRILLKSRKSDSSVRMLMQSTQLVDRKAVLLTRSEDDSTKLLGCIRNWKRNCEDCQQISRIVGCRNRYGWCMQHQKQVDSLRLVCSNKVSSNDLSSGWITS